MICARCGRSASMLFDLGAGRVWCHDCCANAGESAAQDDATLAGIIDELDTIARKHGFPPDAPVDQLPAWLAKRFEQDAETYRVAAAELDKARAERDEARTLSHVVQTERDMLRRERGVLLDDVLSLRAQRQVVDLASVDLRAQVGGLTAACERLKLELAEARETIAALKPHTNH